MTDEREVIRQESFWFTATILGFTAFVGRLLKSPSTLEAILASRMIVVLSLFTVYLLVGRYRKYCQLNDKTFANWWAALVATGKEMSGTLYCVGVVIFSTGWLSAHHLYEGQVSVLAHREKNSNPKSRQLNGDNQLPACLRSPSAQSALRQSVLYRACRSKTGLRSLNRRASFVPADLIALNQFLNVI